MSDREIGTIIFDLDGTLVDSAPDLAGALDSLLEELGFPPLGMETGRSFIGHGIPNLVRQGLKVRAPDMPEAAISSAINRFLEIYNQNISKRSRPYPGALQVIQHLRNGGWRLAVCTNKVEESARLLLSDLGLLSPFAVVAGPDTFGAAKPDPNHVLGCLPSGRAEDYTAILVGDSGVDLATARAAGLPSILVSWGYADVSALEGQADITVARFEEVPDAIDRLVARAHPPEAPHSNERKT